MTIGIGIIGAGIMGADHALITSRDAAGATLAALCDADRSRVEAVGKQAGAGFVTTDPMEVISAKSVDAVIIAAPDQFHAELTLACLKAGKPVLCEKPLAPTAAEGLKVLETEISLGKRLVRLGFMRRFDPAYAAMKSALESGSLGRALMLHCIHRNVSVPPWFTSAMAIANSGVHEIDISRWLLSSELVRIQVFQPRSSDPSDVVTPVIMVMETEDGQVVTVEVFNNAAYGYDVRGELVCERGAISLGNPALTESSKALARASTYDQDWRPRFADAYRLQMQDWLGCLRNGSFGGASTWDGYVASVAAEAGQKSLLTNGSVPISLPERPALYA